MRKVKRSLECLSLLILALLCSHVSAQTPVSSKKTASFESFQSFVSQQWRLSTDFREVLEEYLERIEDRLQSMGRSSEFWEKQEEQYRRIGALEKVNCVSNQMSGLRAMTMLTRMYIPKLQEARLSGSFSPEIFDDLIQIEQLFRSLTQMQESMSQCALEVDMRSSETSTSSELYSTSINTRFKNRSFRSAFSMKPSKLPLR